MLSKLHIRRRCRDVCVDHNGVSHGTVGSVGLRHRDAGFQIAVTMQCSHHLDIGVDVILSAVRYIGPSPRKPPLPASCMDMS